jgi:ATP-dependent DNA helicase Rep
VVARIQSLRETSQHKEWRDFAVLYRANHMAKPFEKALRRANVPYKVSGGQSFFDRAEIKDLCAWFRLWVNNNDDPAFLRAITSPKRGIGHQTLQSLGEFAGKYRLSLFAALFSHSLPAALPARAVGSLHEFGRFVNDQEYRARHTHGAEAARAFLTDWLKDIGYEKHLYEGEENEKVAAARWTNVIEFCDWMGARCGGEIDDAAGGQHRQRKEKPAGSGPDHLAAVHPGRARAGPQHADPVHAACVQRAGMAACDAGGGERGPAAVQARR